MVLGTVKLEAKPRERRPKALKTRIAQEGRIHSDQIGLVMARQEAGPHQRWPKMLKGKLENNSRKRRDLVGKLA